MSEKNQATGLIGWIDERLPILSFIRSFNTILCSKISIFGIFLDL